VYTVSGIIQKTVAMPPKIGGRVSPNGYAPEFSGAVFLQISYTPENRGRSFAKWLCPRNVGAEFSDNNYAPEFSERFFTNNLSPKIGGSLKKSMYPKYEHAVLTYILDSQMLILLCLQQVNISKRTCGGLIRKDKYRF